MKKMEKIVVEKDTPVWINGKQVVIKAGVQEVNEDIARILIQAGYAKAVEKKKGQEKKGQEKDNN